MYEKMFVGVLLLAFTPLLCQCRFNEQLASSWLQFASPLERVEHSREYLSSHQVKDLLSEVSEKRHKGIMLDTCVLARQELASLWASILFSNTSSVSWLSLRHCHLDASALTASLSSSEAATGGGRNGRLKVLDVSFNKFDGKAIRLLTSMISQCSGIETLVLDGNALTPEDMRCISHALRRHPSAQLLSLSSCALNDASMEFVAFCLKSNKNITRLDLSCNAITQEGLEMLSSAFRAGAGRTLVSLDISYNPHLGEAGALALARAFETNQLPCLKHLVLRETGAGPASLEKLLKAISTGSASCLETLDFSGNTLVPSAKKAKSSKDPKKKMKEMVANLAPQFNEAMQTLSNTLVSSNKMGMKLLSDLGKGIEKSMSKPPKAYSLGKKKGTKLLKAPLEVKVEEMKRRKRKGGGKKQLREEKMAVDAKEVQEEKGKKAKKKKSPKLAKNGTVEVNQEAKELAKTRRRTLRSLISAVAMSHKLKFLGLAKVGLNPSACSELKQLAHKKIAAAAATTINATNNATTTNSSQHNPMATSEVSSSSSIASLASVVSELQGKLKEIDLHHESSSWTEVRLHVLLSLNDLPRDSYKDALDSLQAVRRNIR